MKMLKKLAAVSAAAMLMLLLAVPALAAGKLELSTKYTGIYAKPGDTLNFDLDFSNLSDSGQNVKLSAAGLPEHWIGYFEGSGKTISSVYIRPASSGDTGSRLVSYNLTIPDDAQKGDYSFTLKAAAQDGSRSDLQVTVSVTDEAAGSNVLETTYPEQQGDSSTVCPSWASSRHLSMHSGMLRASVTTGTLPSKNSCSLALSTPRHTMAVTFSLTSGSIWL